MKKLLFATIMIFSLSAHAQFLDPKNKDHQLHFEAGFAAGEFGSLLNQATIKIKCDFCARAIMGAAVGVGKELWDDWQPNGKFDLGEATATTIGAIFSKFTVMLGDWIGLPPATMRIANIVIPIILMGKATLNL